MNNRNSFFVFELRERRARESNPQRLAPHLISSQAANHSRTLQRTLQSLVAIRVASQNALP